MGCGPAQSSLTRPAAGPRLELSQVATEAEGRLLGILLRQLMFLPRPTHDLPLVVRAVRSWTLLAGVALLLATIPGLVQVESTETDSSAEQTELTETLAVCVPSSPKHRVALQSEQKCVLHASDIRTSSPQIFVLPARGGHRLANGLLAPLRC